MGRRYKWEEGIYWKKVYRYEEVIDGKRRYKWEEGIIGKNL